MNERDKPKQSAGRARTRFCWPRTMSASVNPEPGMERREEFCESLMVRIIVAEEELAVCRRLLQ